MSQLKCRGPAKDGTSKTEIINSEQSSTLMNTKDSAQFNVMNISTSTELLESKHSKRTQLRQSMYGEGSRSQLAGDGWMG